MPATTTDVESTELLRSFVRCAVLAPSSHNTQPWMFRIDPPRLALYADRTRALPVNDPRDRELTISCGAAWFGVRVGAQAAGVGLDVTLLPEGDASDVLAVATPAGTVEGSGLPSADAVHRRRTHRKAFTGDEVPDSAVDAMRAAVAAEGAHLELLGASERTAVAALIADGDRRQFADPRWRRELASWMHPRRKRDGLAVHELAAPAARFVLGHFDVGRGTADRDAELATRAPLLAVLATADDTPADWLRAGQALHRALLVGCEAGLQAGYLSQPQQVDELRPRVSELLADGGVPQLVLRIGYPTEELDPAPRREPDDVIERLT